MVKISTNTVVFIIVGLAVVIILLAWAIPFISGYVSSIEPPKTGEKNRFLRYVSCALAMCHSGYNTPQTIGLTLEYDDNDKPIKGCNSQIKEIGETLGESFTDEQRLCGSEYALTFEFEETTTYNGNRQDCGPLKTGFQTDGSCYGLRNYMECSCLACPVLWSVYPEGKLVKKGGDCGWSNDGDYGSIFIHEDLISSGVVNCDATTGSVNGLDSCTFNSGTEIDIWAEWAGSVSNYCVDILIWEKCLGPPFGWCGGLSGCNCEKIVIC